MSGRSVQFFQHAAPCRGRCTRQEACSDREELDDLAAERQQEAETDPRFTFADEGEADE